MAMRSVIATEKLVALGETVVVVGAGTSGIAAVKLLLKVGARVRLVERNESNITPSVKELATKGDVTFFTGEHTPEQFEGAKLVVTSPGVPLHKLRPLLEKANNPPLVGEMDLALRFVTEPIIAITGTSGKTTTTTLTAKMLERAGLTVFLGGNIGIPLSEYVVKDEKADVLVLEMSSFQLQSCTCLHPKVAVCINFSENHLDQHTSLEEYERAKFSVFDNQTEDDFAIIGASLLEKYRADGYHAQVETITDGVAFCDSKLAGIHNRQNAEAAFLASRHFGVTLAEAKEIMASFLPLEHRLEKVHELNGVDYINDSKCTTVDALRVALESYDGSIILLAGGKFKGGDLQSLRPLLSKRVKAILLYGGSKDIFEDAWQGTAPLSWFEDLEKAMSAAYAMARAGDKVLLSPATSSYDQYTNYIERGRHFVALARKNNGEGS